jgi:ABC-2 type transport system ATP-binding protein
MFRKRFYQHLLEEYFDGDRTIIITTHQIEEVEHILTDLIFIQDGEIVLHSDMDSMHQRYTELMVADEQLAAALALGPMHQRKVFGRHVLLFEDTDQAKLSQLGELHTPSVADLFVAIMSHPKTPSQAASREIA